MEPKKVLHINTTRFGPLEVPVELQFTFPEGLLGFADNKHYVLLEDRNAPPFCWLQSLDDPDLAFVTIDPIYFMPNYQVEIKESDLQLLELESMQIAKVIVIVVVRERPEDITANLQGPLVINPAKQLGKQIVIMGDKYSLRHPIMASLNQADEQGNGAN